jgi:hypothetical protein
VENIGQHRGHADHILSLKEIQDKMSISKEVLRSKMDVLDMAAESYEHLQVKVVEAIEAKKK